MKIIMEIEEEHLPRLFNCAKAWVDICGKIWFVGEVYFIEPTEKGCVRIGMRFIKITSRAIAIDDIRQISMGDFFQYAVNMKDD